ncbi:MAG: hypothetical protein ABIG45_06170 [Bacillota bacterium]
MKKAIALALVLVSVFALAAAQAQEVEIHREDALFYIVVTLPNGARVAQSQTDGHNSMTDIEFITPGKPSVVITTAADEMYIGQSLSDLTKEEVELIINGITVEMAQPVSDIRKTADGYEYIVVNESMQENDTCDTVMLVNGYFIMVHVFYEDFSELTPEDQEIGPSIVETFRFVGNTNT